MQQRVYECRMNSVDELKQRLVDVWNSLQQNVIDAAINEWRKQMRACVHADGQHFEHLLRTCVTDKSYGQIKYKYLKTTLLYCMLNLWFSGLKVSQGKVRTINRWGGISNHLSMAYLLRNISVNNIIRIGQLLLKLSLVVGWYSFFRHRVFLVYYYPWTATILRAPSLHSLALNRH